MSSGLGGYYWGYTTPSPTQNIKNITGSSNVHGDHTLYTVTSGKTLYVTQISFWAHFYAADILKLYDGASAGGLLRFQAYSSTDYITYTYTFATPIVFTTSIVGTGPTDGSAGIWYVFTGWEQ